MSARLTRQVVITLMGLLALSLMACDGSKTTVIEQAPQATVANELAAMTRLQAIGRAELAYQAESGGQYATLDELVQRRMVNDPSQGKLTGLGSAFTSCTTSAIVCGEALVPAGATQWLAGAPASTSMTAGAPASAGSRSAGSRAAFAVHAARSESDSAAAQRLRVNGSREWRVI